MRMKLSSVLMTVALVAPAHAEGGVTIGLLAAHAFNLALLIFLIVHFAKKPIQRALKARAESVAQEIQAASALHADAAAVLDEYEQKMAGLDTELAELKARYAREGELERERIVAQAQEDAQRILRDAERQAESESRRIRAKLEGEIIDRAIAAATEAIRTKLTPADQRRLTADYLARLEEAGRL